VFQRRKNKERLHGYQSIRWGNDKRVEGDYRGMRILLEGSNDFHLIPAIGDVRDATKMICKGKGHTVI
jgi:hypothetical protein